MESPLGRFLKYSSVELLTCFSFRFFYNERPRARRGPPKAQVVSFCASFFADLCGRPCFAPTRLIEFFDADWEQSVQKKNLRWYSNKIRNAALTSSWRSFIEMAMENCFFAHASCGEAGRRSSRNSRAHWRTTNHEAKKRASRKQIPKVLSLAERRIRLCKRARRRGSGAGWG